jgi:hypothetical protein
MSLALGDLPRDQDQLLQMLQQTTEVIAQQNSIIASLQAERDAVLSELAREMPDEAGRLRSDARPGSFFRRPGHFFEFESKTRSAGARRRT